MDIKERLNWLQQKIAQCSPWEKRGRVVQVTGLVIECEGPEVAIGDVVWLCSDQKSVHVPAEVIGFRERRVLVMPLGALRDIHPGCAVVASDHDTTVPVGKALLGRVIDGLGQPIDELGPLLCTHRIPSIHHQPPNPMKRRIISDCLETGVRAIDAFVPIGYGQRMGIFAGSGVGKSTLLGMLARNAKADINVIALVGERGRELREFIENDLGAEGMKRSVVVVSTSDQSAPLRIRAALIATRIAESFRDEGKNVILMMDSVTRLAMAQREVGLAIGEPPTTRGYTPSVFAILPRLLERSGTFEQGSITGLYTVLVEGDDFNEPVADAVRSILDGHVALNRSLASANHFPAIDILDSVSRLTRMICRSEELEIMGMARDLLALYRKNEDLITIGAYTPRSNLRLDWAIERYPKLIEFLRQSFNVSTPRAESLQKLKQILA